jgi:rSAM/selenodomain-associated transferase 1
MVLGVKNISTCAIGVMARAPSASGKMRLAPHCSVGRLRGLRAALLADTLDVVARAARLTGIDVVIFFTPADGAPEIDALNTDAFPRVCQSEGDLGQRMRSALEHLIGQGGYGAALLVGSDIPFLSVARIVEARETLEANGGLVLGPADDGGYYLIGMMNVHAGLFEQIEWSTATVLTDTLRSADRLGIEARLIGRAYDVDTIDDLHRLERDLTSASLETAPHVRAWFSEG